MYQGMLYRMQRGYELVGKYIVPTHDFSAGICAGNTGLHQQGRSKLFRKFFKLHVHRLFQEPFLRQNVIYVFSAILGKQTLIYLRTRLVAAPP